MTNGDKIRQMSNEELWKILHCGCCVYESGKCRGMSCETGIKAYLDMEVEE
jgi:hypothetical protein